MPDRSLTEKLIVLHRVSHGLHNGQAEIHRCEVSDCPDFFRLNVLVK